MMFGTYENPRHFQKTCGLAEVQEQRVLDMLLFKDVLQRHDAEQ